MILDVIHDLRWLRVTYPAMSILWSTIIPQLMWRVERHAQHVNTVRRSVHREVYRAVCHGLRSVIGHQEICGDRPELFRHDGVHLSERGLDIFLKDIQGGLLLELEKLVDKHAAKQC